MLFQPFNKSRVVLRSVNILVAFSLGLSIFAGLLPTLQLTQQEDGSRQFSMTRVINVAHAANTASTSPSSCSEVAYTTGTISWTSPGNAVSSNDTDATVVLDDNQISEYLYCSNFGFSIPTGSTIDGIFLEVEVAASSNNRIETYSAVIATSSSETAVSNDKGFAGAGTNYWTTTDTFELFGGAADTWGRTYTVSDVNSTSFGAMVAATKPTAAASTFTGSVDSMRITVHYTAPTAPTVTTATPATSITANSATISGNITDTGGVNATGRGFVWGTGATLSGGDTATTSEFGSYGTGGFSTGLSSLSTGVTYYYRAYATNTAGVGYGAIQSFTTSGNLTLSGTLYSGEGTSAITSGKTIKVAVGTSTTGVYSTTTDSGAGTFHFDIPQTDLTATNTPITLWVDGDATTRAALTTKLASTTANVSGLDLWQNHVLVKSLVHDTYGTTTISAADMAFYDRDDDVDIMFRASSTPATSTTLTVYPGQELYVQENSYFAPLGGVVIHGNAGSGTDGSFELAGGARYYGGLESLSIAGNFTITATSSFKPHASGTTFTATTTGKTITASLQASTSHQSIGDITFTGSGGAWSFSENATTTNLSIVAGSVTIASGRNLTIAGDFENDGTFTNNGTLSFGPTESSGKELVSAYYSGNSNTTWDPNTINMVEFSPDGTRMYVANPGGPSVVEYSLTTPYDITSISVANTMTGAGSEFVFSPDGSRLYIRSNGSGPYANGTIVGYFLSIPWDTSTAVATGEVYLTPTAGGGADSYGFAFNSDGTRFYTMKRNSPVIIYSYDLSVPWLVSTSTVSAPKSFLTSSIYSETDQEGMEFSADGRYLYITGRLNDEVRIFELSTPWEVSTSSVSDTGRAFDISSEIGIRTQRDVFITRDGTRMYVSESDLGQLFEYYIPQSTQHASGTMVGSSALGNVVVAGEKLTSFSDNASTTDLTLNGGTTTLPYGQISIAGNFANNANLLNSGGTMYLTGSTKTISGDLTGYVNGLNDVIVTGSYTVSNNASTTDLTIVSGGSFTAPSGGLLTIIGDYSNDGTFAANSATTTFGKAEGVNLELTLATPTGVTQAAGDTSPRGIFVHPEGTTIYNVTDTGGDVTSFPLSTPWDLSSAGAASSYVYSGDISGGFASDLFFSPDGARMYILNSSGGGSAVYSFNLSTPWNVTTAVYSGIKYTLSAADQRGMYFSQDGSKLYTITEAAGVYTHELATPWEVSSSSVTLIGGATSFSVDLTLGTSIELNKDGTVLYLLNELSDTIYGYDLSTPWDVTTASVGAVDYFFDVGTWDTSPQGFAIGDYGRKVYVSGDTGDDITEFSFEEKTQTATGTMTGTSAFYDLIINNPSYGNGIATSSFIFGADASSTNEFEIVASSSVQFTAGATYTFQDVNWDGTVTSPIYLRSTTNNTQWELDINGTQTAVDYVNVKDSDATLTSGGVTNTNSTDSGNNLNWNGFAGGVTTNFNISGTLYDNDGITAITRTATITAAIGTSTVSLYSTTTQADGSFTIEGFGTSTINGFATTSNAEANPFNAIVYGNGKFVAVGNNGTNRFMYSVDGINWTAVAHPAAHFWSDIAYGNGRFVAVAAGVNGTAGNSTLGQRFAYSDDGINWSLSSDTSTVRWDDVVYADGVFYAYQQGNGASSTDGVSWNTFSTGVSVLSTEVVYGNGRFMWTEDSTNASARIQTSTDGVNWGTANPPGSEGWQDVAYGNGRWVAVGDNAQSNRVITSTTGTGSWSTASVVPHDLTWENVEYANGYFFAFSNTATTVDKAMYSSDGDTWTAIGTTATTGSTWSDSAVGAGKIVLVTNGDTNENDDILYADAGFGENTPITLFVDESATTSSSTATTLLYPHNISLNGAVATINADLIADTLVVQKATGSQAVYLSDADFYDADDAGTNATDILFTATTSTTTVNADLKIASGTTVFAPQHLVIDGDFANYGTFEAERGEVIADATWFEIMSARFYKSTSTDAQVSSSFGLGMSVDGQYLYVGENGGSIHQYTLTVPGDISTASFTATLDVSGRDTAPSGVEVSPDGTRLYFVGQDTEDIFQYTLSTPWSISSPSFVQARDLSAQVASIQGLEFSPDGTKMLIQDVNSVEEYTLSTAWDVSSATFVQGQGVTGDYGLATTPDGTEAFFSFDNGANSVVTRYTFGTPWNVSTLSFTEELLIGNIESAPSEVAFSNNGSRMYIGSYSASSNIHQFNLDDNQYFTGNFSGASSLYDLTIGDTATVSPAATTEVDNDYHVGGSAAGPYAGLVELTGTSTLSGAGNFGFVEVQGVASSTGAAMTFADLTVASGATFTASTSLTITGDYDNYGSTTIPRENTTYLSGQGTYGANFTFVHATSVAAQDGNQNGLEFSTDGSKMYMLGYNSNNSDINEYTLTTPWDVSTSNYIQTKSVATEDGYMLGLYMTPDGRFAYMFGNNSDTVYQYRFTTPWDISTLELYGSTSTAAQETSGQGVTLKEDGTILYLADQTRSIHQYALSTPYDVTTASYIGVNSMPSGANTRGVRFSGDGMRIYQSIPSGGIRVYALSAPWDLSSPTLLTTYTTGSASSGIDLKPDGSIIYVTGSMEGTNDEVYQYDVTALIGTSTDFYTERFQNVEVAASGTVQFGELQVRDLTIGENATATTNNAAPEIDGNLTNYGVFSTGSGGIYANSTALDIADAILVGSTSTSAYTINNWDITLSDDGRYLYVSDVNAVQIEQYELTVPWDITTAKYLAATSSVSASLVAMSFKPDGSKLYIHYDDDGPREIREYDLSTPWDITTTDFNTATSLATSNLSVTGFDFNDDGSYMYVTEIFDYRVRSYPLGTPWDISTVQQYDSEKQFTGGDSTIPNDIRMADDGTFMIIADRDSSRSIQRFNLSTPFDVSSANSAADVTLDMTSVTTGAPQMWLSPNGDRMYVGDDSNEVIYQFEMDDIQYFRGDFTVAGGSGINNFTIGDTATVSVAYQTDVFGDLMNNGSLNGPHSGLLRMTGGGQTISGDGNHGFVEIAGTIGATATTSIFTDLTVSGTYNAATNTVITGDFDASAGTFTANGGTTTMKGEGTYQIETVTYLKSTSTGYSAQTGVAFSTNGQNMYTIAAFDDDIHQYVLSIPWDVSSASYVHATSIDPAGNYHDLAFKPDGTNMYVIDHNIGLSQFELSTPWDVSTAALVATSTPGGSRSGLHISPDGQHMHFVQGTFVYYFGMTTPWDITTMYSIDTNGGVPESSSRGIEFSPDGMKFFVVGPTNDTVYEYTVTTPWDTSSYTLTNSYNISAQDGNADGVRFSADGQYMYIAGNDASEILQFDIAATVATTTGTNAFANLVFDNGPVTFTGAASTTGTFTITSLATTTFNATSTYTFTNIDWQGASSTALVNLRSSASGTTWLLDVDGTQDVDYVFVQDSDATLSASGITPARSTDGGNNTNWLFPCSGGADAINCVDSYWYETIASAGTKTVDLSGLDIQENDLVLVALGGGYSADRTPTIVTSGYSSTTHVYSGDTYGASVKMAWKVMSATPDTDFQFSVSPTQNSNSMFAYVRIYRGVDPSNPVDVTSVSATGQNTGIINPAAITPVTAGAKIVIAGAHGVFNGIGADTSNLSSSELSNFEWDAADLGSGYEAAIGIGDYNWTSGAFDPAAFSTDNDFTTSGWVAWTMALRPAGAGGGPTNGPGITITGSLYAADGVTLIARNATITAAIGTSTASRHYTTTSNGTYSITGIATSTIGTWATSTAAGSDPSAIAYGNGMFVASGKYGGADTLYSYDGINWNSGNQVGTPNNSAIAYGNGRFVAVMASYSSGGSGRVQVSEDGINWTEVSAAGDDDVWESVTYGGGKFVAVQFSGDHAVMYSEDGYNWTPVSFAGNNDAWYDIAYGNGRYVAVRGGASDQVMYSDDAINWATSTITSDSWREVVFGDGIFMAASDNAANEIATSSDGITWSLGQAPLTVNDGNHRTLAYGNGTFVGVDDCSAGTVSQCVMYSTDKGATWTTPSVATTSLWTAVGYGAGRFVVLDDNTTSVTPMYADAGFGENTPITLFVDENATTSSSTATTLIYPHNVSKVGAYATVTADLIADTLTVQKATGSREVWLSDADVYDSTDDSDILFTATTSTTTVNANLYITASTTVYAPQHLVIDGDFNNYGTFEAERGEVVADATAYDLTSQRYHGSHNPDVATPYSVHFSQNGLWYYTSQTAVEGHQLSVPWDITSVVSTQSTTSAQHGSQNAADVSVSVDGTKLYVLDSGTDEVDQYTLSTPFDVTTAAFDYATSVPAAVGVNAMDLSPDGTKLYILDDNTNSVIEYTLTTAWDVSTASFVYENNITSETAFPTALAFNNAGTKMFVGDTIANPDTVYEYTLSPAWSVQSASLANTHLNVGGNGFTFSTNGDEFYVTETSGVIGQYHLDSNQYFTGNFTGTSSLFDLTVGDTATISPAYATEVDNNYVNNGSAAGPYAGLIELTGTNDNYVSGSGNLGFVEMQGEYTSYGTNLTFTDLTVSSTGKYFGPRENLTITGDFDNYGEYYDSGATTTFNGQGTWSTELTFVNATSVAAQDLNPNGTEISPDGSKLYMIGYNGANPQIYEYTLTTPYDITTASYVQSSTTVNQDNTTRGLYITPDGRRLYTTGGENDAAYQYQLTTPWDMSSLAFVGSTSTLAYGTNMRGITLKEDGTRMYISEQGREINEFELTTPYDITTARYIRTEGLVTTGSNLHAGLRFSGDGRRMFTTRDGGGLVMYDLSTPWDITTETLVGYIDTSSRDTSSRGAAISSDGRYFYTAGSQFDSIYQYDTTALIGTSTGLAGDFHDVRFTSGGTSKFTGPASTTDLTIQNTATVTAPAGELTIAGNLTKDGVLLSNNGTVTVGPSRGAEIFEYVHKYSTTTMHTDPFAIDFKPDGTKAYIMSNLDTTIYEYSLSTPWDLQTGAVVTDTLVVPVGNDLVFSPDGTKLFTTEAGGVSSGNGAVTYEMSTAWDLSTASLVRTYGSSTAGNYNYGMSFSPDGKYFYRLQRNTPAATVLTYELSTPWEVSTSSIVNTWTYSTLIDALEGNAEGMDFSHDGTQLYIAGRDRSAVSIFELSIPWVVSANSVESIHGEASLSYAVEDTNTVRDAYISPDGRRAYISEAATGNIFVYDIAPRPQSLYGTYTGSSSLTTLELPSDSYVSISGNASATDITIGASSTLRVNRDLSIAGTLTNNGVFDGLGSSVTFTGTGQGVDGDFSVSPSAFYDLTIAGTIAASSSFDVSSLTIASGASFDMNSETITLSGDYTNNGTLTHDYGSLTVGPSEGWDFSTATSVGSVNVSTYQTQPMEIHIKPDGTKMYIAGTGGNEVNEFDLTTAWDIRTASHTAVYATPRTSADWALEISPDGRQLYAAGITGAINKYHMKTPWDLTSAERSGIAFADWTPLEISGHQQILFSPDGTKAYIGSTNMATYDLSIPWDISSSSATYSHQYSFLAQEDQVHAAIFNSDGTELYVTGRGGDDVNVYSLSTPWEISTSSITFVGTPLSLAIYEPRDMFVSPDGRYMYLLSNGSSLVYMFELEEQPQTLTGVMPNVYLANATTTTIAGTNATTSDITIGTASSTLIAPSGTLYVDGDFYNNGSFDANSGVVQVSGDGSFNASGHFETATTVSATSNANVNDVKFSPDGVYMYVAAGNGDPTQGVFQYTLGTPWDVSTAVYSQASTTNYGPVDVVFSPDGTNMYMLTSTILYRYALSTAWDVSTAAYVQASSSLTGLANSLHISPDGLRLYTSDVSGASLIQYSLSSPWDISTLAFVQSTFYPGSYGPEHGISITPNGRYISATDQSHVASYEMTTPWDISTLAFVSAFDVSTQGTSMNGITYSTDGTKLYLSDNATDSIYQYDLASEIGTSTASDAFYGLTLAEGPVTFTGPASSTATTTISNAGATTTFQASSTYTFQNIDFQGTASNDIILRSSSSTGEWYLVVPGDQINVQYVNVSDSNATDSASAIVASNSTDSGNNTNWDFGTANPWNAVDWTTYDLITIDHNYVFDNVYDFPVYVDLADLSPAFWSTIVDGGGDIRVTTDAGTPVELAREVVFASTTLQTGELHFKADYLNPGKDTSFRIYYNGTASDYLSTQTYGRNAVWSNGYEAVYHLNEDPSVAGAGGIVDATGNGNDGTDQGSMDSNDSVAGRVGNAFDFDGVNDRINLGNFVEFATGGFTLSAWFDVNQTGDNAILSKDSSAGNRKSIGLGGVGAFTTFDLGDGTYQASNNTTQNWSTGGWHYLVGVADNATLTNYTDGIATTSDTHDNTLPTNTNDWVIGDSSGGTAPFLGQIDEVRLASSTRTEGWIQTEYYNQNDTTTFYRLTSGTGSTTLADHDSGQVSNAFTYQNKTNEALYAFKLTPETGNATVTQLTVDISGSKRVNDSDFSNIRLYRDLDADAAYDATDTQVGGAGSMVINGGINKQSGTITFTTDFLATTSQNFVVVADWNAPQNGSQFNLSLSPQNIIMLDSAGAVEVLGSVDSVQHNRNNRGGGGSAAAVGPAAPDGDGDVGGGTNDGGELIGSDPDFYWPSASANNNWNNPAFAYDQVDGTYATTSSGAVNEFNSFAHAVPGSDTIQGIEVKLELANTNAAGDIEVRLSWNGGTSWTTPKTSPTLTATDTVYSFGGPSDTWGRSWTVSEFSDANFVVELDAWTPSGIHNLDAIQVKVYHQASGGGSGGGGAI